MYRAVNLDSASPNVAVLSGGNRRQIHRERALLPILCVVGELRLPIQRVVCSFTYAVADAQPPIPTTFGQR
jgi:hypothetical protein